jgi:RHS repeat-associated protein
MKQSGNWFYYLADGLGSTMAIVNATGTVQNSYAYDVYGKPTVTGSLSNEYDFAGQQTDATGLQYLRARYMDPETGTFLSRDLMEEAGGTGVSPYTYAAGRPTKLTDKSGLAPWDDPEKAWCAKRPHWWARCAAGATFAAAASDRADRIFGGESDEADAFRHCVWSACLAHTIGSKAAKTLTDNHERFSTSTDRQEHRKDLWNNKVGRDVGKSIRPWEVGLLGEYLVRKASDKCLDALANGDLIVDKADAPCYPGEENILPGGAGSW